MGLADFFRPKYKHSNVAVRSEAVRALGKDDAAILVQVAKSDRDANVRRLAIEKIDEADVLADIAAGESERSVRDFAGERAAKLWMARACGADAEQAGAALAGMIKLGDQFALVEVVAKAEVAAVKKKAFTEIRDPRALADLAKRDTATEMRLAAVARIDDGDVLRALAIDTTAKEVGLAAVDKIDDADRLEHIATKAKNKAIRARARKIVIEMKEAEKAKSAKPGVSDDVKRRRAEKAQLIREIEGYAETFDFAKASDAVTSLQAAWAELVETPDEGQDDTDARFAKAAKRFWRRKEGYEQQARSADELRAVEREAKEAKDRAAAERAAKSPAATEAVADLAAGAAGSAEPKKPKRERDDGDIVNPAAMAIMQQGFADDEKARLARQAEADERRAARDAKNAEFDAKRASRDAERASREKNQAEQAGALVGTLDQLVADMEALYERGEAGLKDLRVVDRLLQQAGRAFDQIGKIAADKRDELADRYTAVRGKLVIKIQEQREAEDWVRWNNVPKAQALIQTAKDMAEGTATPDLGNRLRGLQALWKEVGPMPQRQSKELWDVFKIACDAVYEKVRGERATAAEQYGEVAKAKEALIAEAEGIAGSDDFAATAEKLKALQAAWKTSGHLPRKQGDELWGRFRAACDKFFARRKPMLDARDAEERANLAKKQALIARAAGVADGAPGTRGWGAAINEVKQLQAEWKEVGYVPRRDADAVYKQFRAACDKLFAKRDEARDGEANAHRAAVAGIESEIGTVTGTAEGASDGAVIVARAIAVRDQAAEHGVFADAVTEMIRRVVVTQPEAVKGTALDPAQLRAARDKLIARAEELLPKAATAAAAQTVDVASQLKAAMSKNAFGDLRWAGRDPIEVVDELAASWAESGPMFDDTDRAQAEKFDAVIARVQDAIGAPPERRRRRTRDASAAKAPTASPLAVTAKGNPTFPLPQPPSMPATPRTTSPTAPPTAVTATMPVLQVDRAPLPLAATPVASVPVAAADAITRPTAIPHVAHDAVTAPARPVAVAVATPMSAAPAPAPARAKTPSTAPPIEEVDAGWDLGDDDPTRQAEPEQLPPEDPRPAHAADDAPTTTPSSSEMAGDGATEGDGLDSGWD